MRLVAHCSLVAVLVALAPSVALADSGAALGESARAASLAGSVVGRPGDTSAIFANPAGIADMRRPTLVLYGHLGGHTLRFARHGESGSHTETRIAGYGASIVAPLPGPAWLRRVRVGGSIHLPGDTLIRLRAPVRDDAPRAFYYQDRSDRTAATVAIGIELPFTLRIGAAVTLVPMIAAPTTVGFDATRAEVAQDGLLIEQQRELRLEPSVIVGVRAQPIEELGVGLVWRQGGALRFSGTFDVSAGAIRVLDDYDFYELIAPMELALGLAFTPDPHVTASLDVSWARWSEYRTIRNAMPQPGFSDTVDVRAGLEVTLHPALRVRLGYAFLPSPSPAQTGLDNMLDAHRHEVAFGTGLDLEPLARVPLRLDLAFRFHLTHEQSVVKDPTAFEGPIDNLGYPGFTSRQQLEQVLLAVSFPLGDPVSVE